MGKLQTAIQRWVRRLLGLPSPDEMRQVIEFLFEQHTRNLEDLRADTELKIDDLHSIRLHVQAELSTLRVTEQNIKARFAELSKAEAQMQKLAGDMTLALYDAVEKIMAEIAEAKQEEKQSDK